MKKMEGDVSKLKYSRHLLLNAYQTWMVDAFSVLGDPFRLITSFPVIVTLLGPGKSVTITDCHIIR